MSERPVVDRLLADLVCETTLLEEDEVDSVHQALHDAYNAGAVSYPDMPVGDLIGELVRRGWVLKGRPRLVLLAPRACSDAAQKEDGDT